MSRYFAFTPYTHIIHQEMQYTAHNAVAYCLPNNKPYIQVIRSILIVFYSNTLNGKQCTHPHRIQQHTQKTPSNTIPTLCCTTNSISSIPYSHSLFILIIYLFTRQKCNAPEALNTNQKQLLNLGCFSIKYHNNYIYDKIMAGGNVIINSILPIFGCCLLLV